MAIAVESPLMLQAILGVAVAVLGLAAATALLAVPRATTWRRVAAIALAVQSGVYFLGLRYLETPLLGRNDPSNPWMRWEIDMAVLAHLTWVLLFAFVPTRVRLRSPRGVLLVAFAAVVTVSSLAWIFAKPLLWSGWPAEPASDVGFNLLARLTMREGHMLLVLALMVVALIETRGRPSAERRGVALVFVGIFPSLFQEFGRSVVESIVELRASGDAFAYRQFLRDVPGDCCDISLWTWAAVTIGGFLVALFFWRETRSVAGLAVCAFGVALMLLLRFSWEGWGFWEYNPILSVVILMAATQRFGALGPYPAPRALPPLLAILAAACVFLAVNAYTLLYGNEIVLAVGIFAGTLLGLAAGAVMLPPGPLALPWTHTPLAGEREVAAYRSAVQAEIHAGLGGVALAEKLRPLRAELGLSDRDHAILEHALRAAPGQPAARLEGGDRLLGRYRIERLLGAGAAGVVYLAHDEKLDRRVALKRLAEDRQRDRAALERLQKETRLASALQHPNIVVVHDVEVIGNDAYIVMEHVPGGSLEDRLRDRPLDEQEARSVARDVLAALDRLHAKGIVHRDVKPSNILFDAEGRAKLSDFSVARTIVSGETVGLTREHQPPVGTLAYMAPEQARGVAATPASDIYSLGASLYAALTGRARVDLDGASEFEARIRVASATPALPLARVSAAMNAVLAKALARSPQERFGSAGEMLRALDEA